VERAEGRKACRLHQTSLLLFPPLAPLLWRASESPAGRMAEGGKKFPLKEEEAEAEAEETVECVEKGDLEGGHFRAISPVSVG